MKPFVGSIWNTHAKKAPGRSSSIFFPNTFQLGGDHRGLTAGGIQQRWIPTIRAPLNY